MKDTKIKVLFLLFDGLYPLTRPNFEEDFMPDDPSMKIYS
jgi:hypothetical protein